MEKDLAGLTAKEKVAKVSFEEGVTAKFMEIQADSEAIEAKMARHGEVGFLSAGAAGHGAAVAEAAAGSGSCSSSWPLAAGAAAAAGSSSSGNGPLAAGAAAAAGGSSSSS